MTREATLQRKCLAVLKAQGIYTINKFGDGRSAKGAPDLICCINGRFVAFELKVDNNDLQDDQKIHRARILKNGGLHYTPRTLEQFKEILEEVQTRGVFDPRRENPNP